MQKTATNINPGLKVFEQSTIEWENYITQDSITA